MVQDIRIDQWYQEAFTLFKAGNFDQALNLCLKLNKLRPFNSAILNLTGTVLQAKGMLAEASNILSSAHDLFPEIEEITLNLAQTYIKMGYAGEGISILKDSIAKQPASSRQVKLLGELLYQQKQFKEAVYYFEKLIKLEPLNIENLFRLGCAYQEADQIEFSIKMYLELLNLEPDHCGALVNMAQAYKSLGEYEIAATMYEKASEIDPDNLLYPSFQLFCLNYGFYSGDYHLKKAVQWAEAKADPLMPSPPINFSARQPRQKLKLGFLSADFNLHAVGELLFPVVCNIDKNKFEIHCFSNVQMEDEATLKFKEVSSNYYDIKLLDDETAAEQISSCGIDILIDLSGHSNFNRLGVVARKPAPIQILWLGYFNTTGMKAMDYIIADSITIPSDQEKYYCEKVLRLKQAFFPYVPKYNLDSKSQKTIENDRIIFGCFNDSGKLNDNVLEVWANILKKSPGSKLYLKSATFSDQWVCSKFAERFAKFDVGTDRVIFSSRTNFKRYLQEYSQVDICLDPFPYSGGATTADALSAGVPVLTCPMETFASRMSASLLHSSQLPELICENLDDYVDKAIALAEDKDLRAKLKHRLLKDFPSTPLCDVEGFTRNFEQILLDLC